MTYCLCFDPTAVVSDYRRMNRWCCCNWKYRRNSWRPPVCWPRRRPEWLGPNQVWAPVWSLTEPSGAALAPDPSELIAVDSCSGPGEATTKAVADVEDLSGRAFEDPDRDVAHVHGPDPWCDLLYCDSGYSGGVDDPDHGFGTAAPYGIDCSHRGRDYFDGPADRSARFCPWFYPCRGFYLWNIDIFTGKNTQPF